MIFLSVIGAIIELGYEVEERRKVPLSVPWPVAVGFRLITAGQPKLPSLRELLVWCGYWVSKKQTHEAIAAVLNEQAFPVISYHNLLQDS